MAASSPSAMGPPSREGLARLGRHFGVGAPTVVGRLHGGAACDVFEMELRGAGVVERVVAKVFPGRMVGAAEFEWTAMTTAASALLPAPEPLAFDRDQTWFGTPTIVMSLLPGAPVCSPPDVAAWTTQLGATLAHIHGTSLDDVPESMRRPAFWAAWSPTCLPSAVADAVAAALTRVRETDWERGLCHGDFHPGNVLFDGHRLTGVVDWVSARWGAVLSDVGRCRCALAVWPGGDAPEVFLDRYLQATNRSHEGLEYWDALSGALTAVSGGAWIAMYRDLEVVVDQELIRDRAVAFMEGALKRARLL